MGVVLDGGRLYIPSKEAENALFICRSRDLFVRRHNYQAMSDRSLELILQNMSAVPLRSDSGKVSVYRIKEER